MDRNKIIKAVSILAALFVAVFGLTRLIGSNSLTLTEYARQNPSFDASVEGTSDTDPAEATKEQDTQEFTDATTDTSMTGNLQKEEEFASTPTLIGAVLNAGIPESQRVSYTASFYYEPLSDNLRKYITGVSFPVSSRSEEEAFPNSDDSEGSEFAITYDDLRYVHILHYDFDGNLAEGELICNEYIAQDLVEIFYELYRNEYQLEKVLLIDEYDGDDAASMEDNNTSCFNYRVVPGSSSLSKHALGLAIDINPLYNPYITYEDGNENIAPANAIIYADRESNFPYKIDQNDLCYQLFTEHGFTWGGNWNSCKDYQHFQKVIE